MTHRSICVMSPDRSAAGRNSPGITKDPSQFVIPIEAVSGVLFVLVALILVGPGQQLGRSLARVSNRIEAYTVNIAGSLAGILLFTACSWWELGPAWWFGGVLAAIAYFWKLKDRLSTAVLVMSSAAILLLALFDAAPAARPFSTASVAGPSRPTREFWSPYYRIHYAPAWRFITVNLIGHQQMSSREDLLPAYALPHLFNRDAGSPPFAQVLVIGAGSGNDVSRALEWGAERRRRNRSSDLPAWPGRTPGSSLRGPPRGRAS